MEEETVVAPMGLEDCCKVICTHCADGTPVTWPLVGKHPPERLGFSDYNKYVVEVHYNGAEPMHETPGGWHVMCRAHALRKANRAREDMLAAEEFAQISKG